MKIGKNLIYKLKRRKIKSHIKPFNLAKFNFVSRIIFGIILFMFHKYHRKIYINFECNTVMSLLNVPFRETPKTLQTYTHLWFIINVKSETVFD